MSFKDRKPFLKEFATNYLKNKIEEKTEAPQETAAAAEEQAEKPEEEKAKAVETEADVAAEQPPEEAPAGEPAAGGAVAAPMDTAAEEPKAVAPAAEVGESPQQPWHNGAQHSVSLPAPLGALLKECRWNSCMSQKVYISSLGLVRAHSARVSADGAALPCHIHS